MKTKAVRAWKPEDGEKFELITNGNASVKLYRRERARDDGSIRFIYEVADYTKGKGRRNLRSFSDLGKARKEAERIAGQLSSGNAIAAQMQNAQAASYGRAMELINHTGATLEYAASIYAKCFDLLGGDLHVEAAKFFSQHRADQLTPKKVAEVATELIEARRARGKSDRYTQDLSSRLTRFANDHAVDISTVTTADVQRWLDKLNVAPQTAKNFRTVLFTLFRFAESRGYILKRSNPVADTEQIEAEDGIIEIYSTEEISRLIESAKRTRRAFLPCLLIGAFAGLRSSEIERLTWQDINLSRGFIKATGKKRGTPSRRLVPIQPNLTAWLSSYSKRKGKVWRGSHEDFYDAQEEIAAGTKGKDQAPVEWKHNALRHSFISYRLAALQDDSKVAMEAGNSKEMVHKHYKELVTPEDAAAWFAIAPAKPANVIPMEASHA